MSRDQIIAEQHENAVVIFADIVGFTARAKSLTAEDLVDKLDSIFSACDALADLHGIEKIKTIGDAYFAVAGLRSNDIDPIDRMMHFALDLNRLGSRMKDVWPDLKFRIAVHNGPVVSGVIGKSRFAYDIWGDTINFASRLVSFCQPDEILISHKTETVARMEFDLATSRKLDLRDIGVVEAFPLIPQNS